MDMECFEIAWLVKRKRTTVKKEMNPVLYKEIDIFAEKKNSTDSCWTWYSWKNNIKLWPDSSWLYFSK